MFLFGFDFDGLKGWAHVFARLQFGWLALLVLALLLGRVFCSAMCPLGIFQDVVRRVAIWVLPKRRVLPGGGMRREWRKLRMGIFYSVIFCMAFGVGAWAISLLAPFSLFGRMASALGRPFVAWANNGVASLGESHGWWEIYTRELHWANFWVMALSAAMLLVIVVMAAGWGRLWCNTICPVGTLLGCVSRKSALRLRIKKGSCARCGDCASVCKAGCIDLRKHEIDTGRCVSCFDCVGACESGAIGFEWAWKRRDKVPPAADAGGVVNVKENAGRAVNEERRRFLTGAALFAGAVGGGAVAGKLLGKSIGGNLSVSAVCPPGSGSVDRFLDLCTGCAMCVSACPGNVLQTSVFAYGELRGMLKPRLDFVEGFCTYDCTICGNICPTRAILPLTKEDKKLAQIGIAEFFRERCVVVEQGSECGACGEHCPTRAIEMVLYAPGDGTVSSIPKVTPELCIGCGGCEYVCPVTPEKAIIVKPLAVHGRAEAFKEKALEPPKQGGFAF